MTGKDQPSPPRIQAAGAVVFRGDPEIPEFLLLRNARHLTWAPPKGHLQAGETLEEAAGRELAEELGGQVELDYLAGFREESTYDVAGEGGPRRKRVTFFLARLVAGTVRRSAEHDALVWAGLDTALATVRHAGLRRILTRAAAFLKEGR